MRAPCVLRRLVSSSAPPLSSWPQLQSRCLRALQSVIHPDTQHDVVYSGLVHKLEARQDASVLVQLDVDRHYRDLRARIGDALRSVPGVDSVDVRMAPIPAGRASESTPFGRRGGLAGVRHVIAVSSCKGGVGKSTVAVNVAYGLRQLGLRVGLLDADLFGPSLPTLIGRVGQRLARDDAERRVLPLVHAGVACVSYGFLAPDPGAATVLRGPVSSQIAQQLALGTAWGQLDYLVIDMPPGTGDVQLSLMQALSLTANVVVTTPQLLSHVDVVKGLAMYDKLGVSTIGAVNNMAYFVCGDCHASHYPFGKQAHEFLAEFRIAAYIDLPIQGEVGRDADRGIPTMLSTDPVTAPMRGTMASFIESLHAQVKSLQSSTCRPRTSVDGNGDLVFSDAEATSVVIGAERLRRQCQCAACLGSGVTPGARRAINVQAIGNYGVEVEWDDGHRGSIYSFDQLRRLGVPTPTEGIRP